MINPSEIPQIPGDMDVLAAHGESLRTVGSNLGWTSLAVDSTWQGLAPVYDAPEAWQLLAATAPVRTTGYDVGADVGVVGRAIVTYADEVRPIQAQLQSLQSQATTFVESVEGDDDWNEDGDKVEEHNGLLTQVNAAVAAWMDAQRTCANTINALYGGIQYRPDDGDGVQETGEFGYSSDMLDEALNSEDGLPWGTPEEEDLPWWEDGLNMVGSFLKGVVVDGIWGTLVGLFNMVNVFDWDTFTATWAALGKLAFIITNPVLLVVNEFTAIPGFEQGEMLDTLTNVGKGLIAYDMWGEDPARAAGAVTFNVVALVGTAGVGTAATGVATTARVAGATRTAAVATRTAEIAASFPRVSSLTTGLRFSDDALRITDDALPSPTATMSEVREAGIVGENLAGIDQAAKVRIPSATDTAAYRIPDSLTDTTLTEVKNVQQLSYTSQLQDFYLYSASTGRSFDLVVRQNTRLSGPLQDMVDAGSIHLRPHLP